MTELVEIAWRTTDIGMLMGPPFYHDGILTDFAFGADDTCRIGIRPVSGAARTEIVLSGISLFGISDLTRNEIVLDIFIYRLNAPPAHVRDAPQGLWDALYPNCGESSARAEGAALLARGRDDFVFDLVGAMGGEIAVLCRAVQTFMAA
jgi:hypothetical protein